MQQFIPFEDDWDALENLRPDTLVPYHVGVPCRHDLAIGDPRSQQASSSPAGAPSATPVLAALPSRHSLPSAQ